MGGSRMPELSNYAICYEAIQRVYRNAVIRAARSALEEAHGHDWLKRVRGVFEREWRGVVDAAREIRVTGNLEASLIDEFDCLGVNHFHNLFDVFFDNLFPRAPGIGDNVRNQQRKAVLRFAKEVNDYRNAMSHPSEEDLPERDAKRLLDSAHRLLVRIDPAAATQILDYEKQLQPAQPPEPPAPNFKEEVKRGRTERKLAYHDFFTKLLAQVKRESPSFTKRSSVGYDSWLSFSIGRTGFGLNPAFARGGQFRVELYISSGNRSVNKLAFDELDAQREDIERELRERLQWERLDQGKDCRIYLPYHVPVDPAEPSSDVCDWAVRTIFTMNRVLRPRVKSLNLRSGEIETAS